MALKSIWKRYWTSPDTYRPPEKDEHMVVSETLMSELDYHIKEMERLHREHDHEEEKQRTGVDYSWLVSEQPKGYEIPQLERLELEELCYKVSSTECGKIVSLFRDALLREPGVRDLTRIMRACIAQVVEQRPKEESLTEWLTRRSLTSLKIRQVSKVAPSAEMEDIEMQNPPRRENRAMSMPNFSVSL
ncbi:hypothetical protein SNE40_021957 [Patella caerulea]|uniref:Uncharacterized protein n=1 Tax=Patella caerulea TaxID=87958 RepID=A0AAN8G8X4_PATCE